MLDGANNKFLLTEAAEIVKNMASEFCSIISLMDNRADGRVASKHRGNWTRVRVIGGLIGLAMAALILQLFRIQIIDHKKYLAQADAMQTDKQTINAERGQIYVRDVDGNIAPLVMNKVVYTLFADPSSIKDVSKVRDLVNEVAGDTIISDSMEKLSDKKMQYLVLARGLDNDQAKEIKKADLNGLGLQASAERVYPEGTLAAQVLGFVNSDGEGQYGVEQALNSRLKGKNGVLQTVTDVRRIPLTIGAKDISVPAQNGENVVLSIDRNVQSQAEQVLAEGLKNAKATTGSMVVMDPQTGRVLAMANSPSYDPANYGDVESASQYQNNVVSNAYEPGSVMKLFTVGTGLNEGVITPESTYYNTSCIMVDDAKICNVTKSVSGQNMTPMNILEHSLNTGAVWVLEQLGGGSINLTGRQKLYKYLTENYRMNKPTGIEQAAEADSVIYKPDMKSGARVLYANMTFGQGEQLTMIQVISAFSSVINGGNYYQPTVVLGTLNDDGETVKENQPKVVGQSLKQDISYELRDMLYQARYLGAGGKSKDNGYYVGGKSGTAQKVDPNTGAYSDNLTTGTYIGFGADKTKTPKYAIMVRVDDAKNGGYSGSAAAQPIFDSMSNFMIQYEGVSK